jgi:hypothetical protein
MISVIEQLKKRVTSRKIRRRGNETGGKDCA